MAPIKFEDHIKDKLNKREITPKKESWNKIVSQVNTAEIPLNNRKIVWYGIAASFIGLVIVSILFFNTTKILSNKEIQIVDAEKKSIKDNIGIEEQDQSKEVYEDDRIINQIIVKNTTEVATKNEGFSATTDKEHRISTTDSKEAVFKESKKLTTDTEEIIAIKIAEVIAQVNVLEQDNISVTDTEIDSLLRLAQKEIMIGKIENKDGGVDAMALLGEVEDELDKSFRDQIFENLKNGYLKVKTAVADRNN